MPIHLVGGLDDVIAIGGVENTVVAASEPRLPTIRTAVVMGLAVGFSEHIDRSGEVLVARVGDSDLAVDILSPAEGLRSHEQCAAAAP